MNSREEIINAVQNAGIVGAGGAGFPTYYKLKSQVEIILANGSECEPLLATDKTVMKLKAERLIQGIKVCMAATGAKKGYVAIKGYYEDVVAAVRQKLPKDNSIEIFLLDNYYPAGDEFLLVYDITGRVIPEGGLPLNVGVVVCNVVTMVQISEAVEGKPVTERILTVSGEVKKPQVMSVPVGTSYRDVIMMAGGPASDDIIWLDGGPFMGNIITDLDTGVAKTTSGVLGLLPESLIVRQKKLTLQQMVKLSKAGCNQCMRCTDLCPRNLLGHGIFPHKTMRTIDYDLSEPSEHITSAYLCSQCGICELIACDSMLLSPKKIYAGYRKELAKRGIKNPHTRKDVEVHSEYENRKVSSQMVIKKMGLGQYSNDLPFEGKKTVKRVRVPIGQHIGSPAQSLIRMGEKVKIGDLIASSPRDQLGACYHASIGGEITDVNDLFIEIAG